MYGVYKDLEGNRGVAKNSAMQDAFRLQNVFCRMPKGCKKRRGFNNFVPEFVIDDEARAVKFSARLRNNF